MSSLPAVGSSAPDFALAADDGSTVRLKDLKGRTVVVYFYPRDDTPGCTREACAFRDRKAELAKLGVVVLGLSADDVKSHGKFRDKYSLNFPLLADVDHRTAEAYGAWREKNMYGKKSWGIVRSTFLIDAAGIVRRVWPKVSVDGHDAAVIEAVKELGSKTAAPTAEKKLTEKKSAEKRAPSAKASAVKKPAKPAQSLKSAPADMPTKQATAKKKPARKK